MLKNLAGLDGCGRIIQFSDSPKLEPINLVYFDIELIENNSVRFSIPERTDFRVIKVVEIESLE